MPTPRNDSYTVPSGGSLYAGLAAPAPPSGLAALRFNLASNSQYLALLRALGVLRNG